MLAHRFALALSATLLGFVLTAAPSRAQSFQTAAPFALLVDYESGAVLYEKNADQAMAPAATAKLMTAEIVFRELKEGRLHLDDKFAVSEHAWRTGGAHSHGPAMFLDIHSKVRIEDLLRGLIVQSGNDAAIVARGGHGRNGGSLRRPDEQARRRTRHDPFDLRRRPGDQRRPGQQVTARDMALLAAHVIRDYPDYYHYFGEKEFTWNKIHQLNRNPLLNDGHRRRRPEDRRHRRERLRPRRLGGAGRPAADRRRQRPQDGGRTRRGIAQAVRLGLPLVRPARAVPARRNDRHGVGLRRRAERSPPGLRPAGQDLSAARLARQADRARSSMSARWRRRSPRASRSRGSRSGADRRWRSTRR